MHKFGVKGLLTLPQRDFTVSCGWIYLSKTSLCSEGKIFCIKEKDWYIDTKDDDKESMLLFFHKTSVLFYLYCTPTIKIE